MSLIICNIFAQPEEGICYLLLQMTRKLWYSGLSEETKVSLQESITKRRQGKPCSGMCMSRTLAVQLICWLESPDFC